jgi:hypothetical protein
MVEIPRERITLRRIRMFPNEFRPERRCTVDDGCILRRVMSSLVILRERLVDAPLGCSFVAALDCFLRAFGIEMGNHLYLGLVLRWYLGAIAGFLSGEQSGEKQQ